MKQLMQWLLSVGIILLLMLVATAILIPNGLAYIILAIGRLVDKITG